VRPTSPRAEQKTAARRRLHQEELFAHSSKPKRAMRVHQQVTAQIFNSPNAPQHQKAAFKLSLNQLKRLDTF
jgi:hypothetical protein